MTGTPKGNLAAAPSREPPHSGDFVKRRITMQGKIKKRNNNSKKIKTGKKASRHITTGNHYGGVRGKTFQCTKYSTSPVGKAVIQRPYEKKK